MNVVNDKSDIAGIISNFSSYSRISDKYLHIFIARDCRDKHQK